ncbi:hypothetical protein ACOSQ3_024979 [Xanthoceras sorbifolium]
MQVKMADELKFQQRWEFRRKEDELDSSSDDLKSSSNGQPVLKKHNLVAGLISLDNDETSNTSKLEQNCNYNPDMEAQAEFGQTKAKRTKRSRKNSQAKSETKRDSHKEVDRKKSRTGAYDTAAMDDVRNFTDSLIEDLKVTRENLFVWMREEMSKLVADTAPKRRRRKGNPGGKKLQVQQHQNNLEENVQLQNLNNFEENIQAQHANNNGAIVQVQQENDFGEDIQEQQHQNNFEKNAQVQHQGKFKSGTRARKCNGGPSKRFAKSSKAAESKNDHHAVDYQVDFGQATGLRTSAEQEKGDSIALTVNSNVQSGSANQNVRVQQPKSVVLAIRAQTSKDKSSERFAKGKKISDSNKGTGYSQAIGSLASTEKDTPEGLRLSADPSLPPISSNQVASSMYLTLPTVLGASHDLNNRLETTLCNYIQPRVAGNKTCVNLERANQILDPGTHYGYLTSLQPEERNGNFDLMGSRIMSCFDENTTPTSSTTGTGFPVPLHQSMDGGFTIPNQFRSHNLPQESNNTLGLRMNGGAITFSEGSYTLSDQHFVGNNLQSHSNLKADATRLMPYKFPTIPDSYLFPK